MWIVLRSLECLMKSHIATTSHGSPPTSDVCDLACDHGLGNLRRGPATDWGGGGDLEDFAPTPAFFSAKTYPGHHFVMIEVNGDKLSMRMQDLNGVIRDWS